MKEVVVERGARLNLLGFPSMRYLYNEQLHGRPPAPRHMLTRS